MVVTRKFAETVRERAQRDAGFRSALLAEAAEAIITGEAGTTRTLLRNYINATLGFETLAAGAMATTLAEPRAPLAGVNGLG